MAINLSPYLTVFSWSKVAGLFYNVVTTAATFSALSGVRPQLKHVSRAIESFCILLKLVSNMAKRKATAQVVKSDARSLNK